MKNWTLSTKFLLLLLLMVPLAAWTQGWGLIEGSKLFTKGNVGIRDGYLRVGFGSTPGITPGQDDVFVEGTLEVDGAAQFDGAVTFNAATTLGATAFGASVEFEGATADAFETTLAVTDPTADRTITLPNATGTVLLSTAATLTSDLTVSADSTGGNAGAANQIQGLFKLALAAPGALTDGTGDTTLLMDDTPNGECAPIGGNGTEALDANDYRVGAASYKFTFDASVGAGEGVDCTVSGHANAASTSVGFWFKSDVTFAAGDLEVVLDDGASAEATENLPAYSTANVWQWIEVDVTGDCAATCADIDGVFVQTTAQAPTTFNDASIWLDSGAIWLIECEKALGHNVLEGGVLSVAATLTGQDQANTPEILIEWTNYFVNYQTGNDVICAITDESAESVLVLVAYQ